MASMYDADNDAIFGKNLNVYSPMTITPDFRALCAELLADLEVEAYAHWVIDPEDYPLFKRARAALSTPPPDPTTSQITFNDSSTEEVIRLDKEGFHYKGQFIADAGEAHRLMLSFLKQHAKVEQEPPTVMQILELSGEIEDAGLGQIDLVRAALERWGAK